MNKTKLVSFDLDGTITDTSFVDSVWLEGIPRLYASKWNLPLEDAKTVVKREYDKVGRERLEWYDPGYWIRKFELDVSPKKLLNSFENRIQAFPEVPEVLEEIKDTGLRRIIVSNARREFIDLEINKTNIAPYFERVFSATSDFRQIKKSVDIFKKVCNTCGIMPQEMVHVGDDRLFDFQIPRRLGIKAFYLDRTGQCKQKSALRSLQDLNKKLAIFSHRKKTQDRCQSE
jgi:putative hydrolase of the HAD superfamily